MKNIILKLITMLLPNKGKQFWELVYDVERYLIELVELRKQNGISKNDNIYDIIFNINLLISWKNTQSQKN